MSRPTPISDGPAASARDSLPETAGADFDRLAGAVLSSRSAPLGAVLRAQLPGTAGVRWLRQEGLLPTTRATELTAPQWLSLFECWTSAHPAPGPQAPGGRQAGRPSTHGHARGTAIPRWGQ